MATKIDYMELLTRAESEIMHCLPEDYEIDDVSWCDDGFRIPVFCVRTMESSMHPVDSFRFQRHAGETDEETMKRFYEELKNFEEGWREVQ